MAGVLAGAVALGLALVALDVAGAPVLDLVRDPAVISDSAWWTGSISLVGLLLWAAAAGMLLITGLVLLEGPERERARFFLSSAALVGWLAVDDALLLHEDALPHDLGVPQAVVFLVYGLAAGAWALRFRRYLVRDAWLLAVVVGGFGASVLLDNANSLPGVEVGYRAAVAEDWAKYVALGALLAWALVAARRALLGLRGAAAATPGEPGGTLRP